MITIPERLTPENEKLRKLMEQHESDLRVASPGIIKSFDPVKQTVTVQLCIKEAITIKGKEEHHEVPIIPDVPIFMPRAGGYLLTLPIAPGDECLVVFGDNCIDSWYQSGGVQQQMELRRHDLSDAFAIVGIWSQPRKIAQYSTNSAQLRDEAGANYIEIKDGIISVVATERIQYTAPEIHFHARDVRWSGEGEGMAETINLQANTINLIGGDTHIDGRKFLTHHHTDVQPGPATTGDVE